MENNITVCESQPELTFECGTDDKFAMTDDEYKKVVHQYRFNEQEIQNQTDGESGLRNMGEVIVNMVDKDRLVKATPNNPQSSRNHTVVYIQLEAEATGEDEKKKAFLFVGDFAGVENSFACDDIETIKKFANMEYPRAESVVITIWYHLWVTPKGAFL